jgi:hypothetical protein
VQGGHEWNGGGIWSSGNVILTDSLVQNNKAEISGGGIFFSGHLTLRDGVVRQNVGGGGGGSGIWADAEASLSLEHSTVSKNTLGGIYAGRDSQITISHSSIVGNDGGSGRMGVPSGDGGIYGYFSTITVEGSSIAGNATPRVGGGIATYASNVTLVNSTVSGNRAGDCGGGIGGEGSTLTLRNATVYANAAGRCGGGIYSDGMQIMMANSLLTGNSGPSGSDCWRVSDFASLTSEGYNLIGKTAGCGYVPAAGDLTSVDPRLGLPIDFPESPRYYPLLSIARRSMPVIRADARVSMAYLPPINAAHYGLGDVTWAPTNMSLPASPLACTS